MLAPTTVCDCITQHQYDSIFEHDLNDSCQVNSEPAKYGEGNIINVFNFYGPVYGDINAEEDEETPEID